MKHYAKEVSNEELDAWIADCNRHDAIAAAADEVGGPSLSLVTTPDRVSPYPTDLLPPADAPGDDADPVTAEPFDGVPLTDSRKRLAGWSAERQRLFLAELAETGSVHLAASGARLSARSAYRLRMRSPEFAAAWDTAEQLAVGRLSALAFDRAINGRTEQTWHQGNLTVEKRMPSDKLLTWLLARLDPRRFAAPSEMRRDDAQDPQAAARKAFPDQLETLTDLPA
ncbi:MAG: hypothetical protein EON93_02795 [Burkholderiales bacterium]|nr:MAG: hypothetical protein EON93_02795 [Burkholderiales bacterium]